MSKKKGKSKPRYKEFGKMLRENSKKIYVISNGKKVSLEDATTASIKAVKAAPLEGIIPISSTDAAETRTEMKFSIDTRYVKPVFALHEYAMKYKDNKQTLVITVDASQAEYLFDYGFNQTISSLLERTNINLILKSIEKAKNKLRKWLENDAKKDLDSFIINIPNVILFTGDIMKKDISASSSINIMVQIVKTKKNMDKLKKKNPEKFKELVEKITEDTVNAAINLGNSTLHVELNPKFYLDAAEYANIWGKLTSLNETNKKLLNMIVFTTDDSDDFVRFSNVVIKNFIASTLND